MSYGFIELSCSISDFNEACSTPAVDHRVGTLDLAHLRLQQFLLKGRVHLQLGEHPLDDRLAT